MEIIESYKDYEPPIKAKAVAHTLLRYVPPRYLAGLGHIVLTNSSSLPRSRRRGKTWSRKRKVKITNTRGLYHQKWGSQPAWIEIFVDNMTEFELGFFRNVPPIRDMYFGGTLYHELGHHIHRTLRPEHREREDVADEWKNRLLSAFIRKRYWYLLPIMHLFVIVVRSRLFKGFEVQKEAA